MKKLNVLFILVDQLRADYLGYAGHKLVQTPHLDQLAREGTTCTNAFTPSPVCMAARAALLTGRSPASCRVHAMGILPPSETTTPELFQRAGYRTGLFGKVHVTPQLYTQKQLGVEAPVLDWRRFAKDAHVWPATGGEQDNLKQDPCKINYGFQDHVGADDTLRGNHKAWVREKFPELADAKPSYPFPEVSKELFISAEPSQAHHSTFCAKHTVDFIVQNADQPWFAQCGFIHPHHPFDAPADQLARYAGVEIPDPKISPLTNDDGLIPAPASGAIGEINKYPEPYRKEVVRHYMAAISLIDDCVGKLVAALKETGQYDNTVIVFTSDHGEFLFERGLLRKPSLHFDDTLKVPMLIRAPGAAPTTNTGFIEHADLHPTLLSLAGLPINPGVQGADLSSDIMQGNRFAKQEIMSELWDLSPQVFGKASGPYMATKTLRTHDWKLNLYPGAGPEYGQLFNLKNDPEELVNLYNQSVHREKQHELTWRLMAKSHQEHDPLPLLLTQW